MGGSSGGGSSGSSIDYEYNARMAKVAEQQQDMSSDYFAHWEQNYKPMEIEQINANRSLIPLEVEQSKSQFRLGTAQANATLGLLPQQTEMLSSQYDLGTAQANATLGLLPEQTEMLSAQYGYGKTKANVATGALNTLYQDVQRGPDIRGEMDYAGSQVAAGYHGAAQKTAADTSRMGLGAMMSRLGSSNTAMGSSVATAKNDARRQAKDTHTKKLGALGGLGSGG